MTTRIYYADGLQHAMNVLHHLFDGKKTTQTDFENAQKNLHGAIKFLREEQIAVDKFMERNEA